MAKKREIRCARGHLIVESGKMRCECGPSSKHRVRLAQFVAQALLKGDLTTDELVEAIQEEADKPTPEEQLMKRLFGLFTNDNLKPDELPTDHFEEGLYKLAVEFNQWFPSLRACFYREALYRPMMGRNAIKLVRLDQDEAAKLGFGVQTFEIRTECFVSKYLCFIPRLNVKGKISYDAAIFPSQS